MGKIRIALMSGGWSKEREISLAGGDAAYRELDKSKYHVRRFDPRIDLKKIIEQKKEIDLAFILLHGKYGEDGCIQGLMDILGIPFVGSGVLASAMAGNKKVAKKMYRSEGLNVAKDVVLKKGAPFSITQVVKELGKNTVVKPLEEGSSLGMSVCGNEEELLSGIDNAFKYGDEIIIETFVKGREISCCVLGNNEVSTLPLIEIVPGKKYRFFDFEAKYTDGATEEICPAKLDRFLEERACECAIRAHRALGCTVWSRSDMIIRNEEIYLLETNTIPGMTNNSLFPLAARTAGMTFSKLLDKLIAHSLDKN